MDALADLASDHAANAGSIPGLDAAQPSSSAATSAAENSDEAASSVAVDQSKESSTQPMESAAAAEQPFEEAAAQIEQSEEVVAAGATVEAPTTAEDSAMQAEAAPTEEPVAAAEQAATGNAQDTQASLDSLLGSLVSNAPQEEASASTGDDAQMTEANAATTQGQDASMSMPPYDDIAAALASAPVDMEGDIPGMSAVSAEASAPNASQPAIDTSPVADMSMQEEPSASAQQDIKPFAQASAEPSQPTPSGSPFPKQQSQDFQAPPPASYTQAVAPITSTGPSGSPTKTTPLASDPSIARQTAQQLLDRKPASTLSRLAKLRQRVEKNKYDGAAWLELIQDASQKGDLEKTREVYNAFLKNFPDNAREWIAFADLELSHGNNDRVNEIFGRCLRGSPSVALWHFYLTYIRRTNPIDRSSIERAMPARDVITKAFEFSLAHVGVDIEAGMIWHDYIEFLKEGDVTGTWEAQQKMDKLRQTYQRAVCIPLLNIEQIWRDYDAFENNLNRATAKKFLQDRSPAYMTARATSRQLQTFMDRLPKEPVPRQPNWDSTSDRAHIETWKSLLQYEESDPMELGDPAAVRMRTMLAYKKAIAQLRFYPEIWYMVASYAKKVEKADEATTFYKAGMEANPTSLLVHYAYIESEEGKGNFEECHKVYNALVERIQAEIEAVNTATKTEINEALAEKARLEAQEKEARNQNQNMDDADVIGEDVRIQERENIKKAIEDSRAGELDELKRLGANVWIMQMRFARRAEGIQAARSVFSRARKWLHTTWQVFEASAMLELHWNKEQKIATNVFEVGLKRFGEEIGFVVRYLDFLLAVNDDGNARAVFERTISKIPAEKARPLWRRWADHEYLFGDLAAIQKLDARLAETYPDEPAISRFTERHTYLDLDDIAYRDLGQDDNADRGGKREATTPPPSQNYGQMPPQHQQQSSIPPYQQQPPPMMAPQQQQSMPGSMPPQQMPQPGFGGPPGPPSNQGGPPLHFGVQGQPYPGPGNLDGGYRASPSIDGDRGSRGGPPPGRNGAMPPQQYAQQNKRRRSPSPPGRRGRRATSPNRVSRHTPPDDFPEAIPWLMAQLPSKTVFAAHGPILDWQHLLHLLMTSHIPLPNDQGPRGRDRSISPRRRMNGPGGRRRSPDYGRRR